MLPGLRYRLPDVPPSEQRAEVLRRFDESIVERRLHDLRQAQIFNEIAQLGIHLHEGASSVADLAAERGMTFSSAREIENLGKAIVRSGEIVPDLEQGRMPVANGAVLGRLDVETEVRPGEDWVEWARTESPRDFLRRFQERRDEVRQGAPVVALVAHVTYQGRRDFERARNLASRSARTVLTTGQTVGVVVDEYLDAHDPLRTDGAERRLPDTGTPAAAASGNRYVPAAEERKVRWRNRDKCAVKTCSNDIFLTLSHRKPHREGGSREADNLDLLCGLHHTLYEQGWILIEGTADAPVIKTADGRRIGGAPDPHARESPPSDATGPP